MKNYEIENHLDLLFSRALSKCGNLDEAEELMQETVLCALVYLAKGKKIDDLRAFLLTVMNRRYNDMLRKRYRHPVVRLGDDFDIIDDEDVFEKVFASEEAEIVRREIAYLKYIYREVIVLHYMEGKSIPEIAAALGIPEGTVKTRLSSGRARVKKGMEEMKNYENQSFKPVTLWLSFSGNNGVNGEPYSLINGDLIAQNLLWLAYPKPASASELARGIGIPMAYIEPILKKLYDGELMRKIGDKYYTDFIISTLEDKEKYIPAQKELVREKFEAFWNAIEAGFCEVRGKEWYLRGTEGQKNALDMYFAFNCLDYGIYNTFNEIYGATQIFPNRPNGGRWNAFGTVHFEDFDYKKHMELMKHQYSGERCGWRDDYLGSGSVVLRIYGAEGFPNYLYNKPHPDFKIKGDFDTALTELLYIIEKGIEPKEVALDTEVLKAVPHFAKCKILRMEEGKPRVDIPVLSLAEWRELKRILEQAREKMQKDLLEILREYYKDKKQEIPPHIESVPLQKQYLNAGGAFLFATIREAIKRGKLYDGDYDNDDPCVHQAPPPMVLIIDK